jgi:hypothetical protein
MSVSSTDISAIERSTMRKVAWRLLPFLILCYLLAIIDRGNIGMASLQMNHDLGLTPAIFGLASSLFFVSYFLVSFRRVQRSFKARTLCTSCGFFWAQPKPGFFLVCCSI